MFVQMFILNRILILIMNCSCNIVDYTLRSNSEFYFLLVISIYFPNKQFFIVVGAVKLCHRREFFSSFRAHNVIMIHYNIRHLYRCTYSIMYYLMSLNESPKKVLIDKECIQIEHKERWCSCEEANETRWLKALERKWLLS